ncbi:hypothetical protein [Embleya scabrispora]|uniref:hypothetical protein n=1 Tax=Embleya scabrispora TaxID=159449 RepID=UPI00035DD65D|nr:hypothetical protein [Embleya scabrispora]MYS84049.1 hypothetical protein [Streptomyces sp. SID5474]
MKTWALKLASLAGGIALAATALTGSAQAVPSSPSTTALVEKTPGAPYQTSDGWCHFSNWGGNFYCLGAPVDAVIWQKPDGYPQVFVLGTNRAVYSRWSTSSGVSGWYSGLGGSCNPESGFDSRSSGWSITIACVGTDSRWWHTKRSTSGTWSGWKLGKGF